MESFLPLGGFQLPFQKRLSRLYNDTKKSSEFVKEPVQNEEDPEIKALHRKLRIQKDRLVSWGLEWSDPTQSAEIDESLSKAGLSEVVGSIMSTIKDILAEAEPLWLSSKRIIEGPQSSADRKAPLVQWDKGRFEDLVNDLTTSIDTLYDLSRTRSLNTVPRRPSKAPYKSSTSEELRPFESTRIQTPQQISPQTLTHLRSKYNEQNASLRQVVFMSKTAYAELPQGLTRQPWAPLLLEYATFDSIYTMTGIMPPMARFEKLSAGLQQDSQRSPGAWTGLPRLLGYFEDLENSRLGLVYRFPQSFNAVSFEQTTQSPLYHLPTLGALLSQPGSEPKLEAKFRLAHNLTNTIFDMHARGITHGNLMDKNISFCDAGSTESHVSGGAVDVRRPLVSSFDVFPDDISPAETVIYRHPLDPRTTPTSPLSRNSDQRVLDLYSLGMLLLSVGLWTKLETLVPDAAAFRPDSLLELLAVRCGSLYAKAVQACLNAVDDELAGKSTGEALLAASQVKASRLLEACCILDGVSGLEERMDHEIHEARDNILNKESSDGAIPNDAKSSKGIKSPSRDFPEVKKAEQPCDPTALQAEKGGAGMGTKENTEKTETKSEKVRLYPHVPLPPDVVDKWNAILMPQINHALRQFYRKNPESVEISLESVGTSPQKTQPTVLVVCTSVGKVRAILKKRLGDLFDDTTGFALKVCRGHVLRSHRQSETIMRSLARRSHTDDDEEIEAVNPDYQERPNSGASIGAWIGDRHLPPVSLGGLIMVDNEPYGMTVHHMLDDPERDMSHADTARSSGIADRDWYAQSSESSAEDDFAYDLSDTESEPYSDTDITSDYEDEEDEDEDEEYTEPGDIPGIEPECGDGFIITQPALDDVEDGFYPDDETAAEDHLDTYSLGKVYASSGIRRKNANGLIHEVDWALFKFADERLPRDNLIPRVKRGSQSQHDTETPSHRAFFHPTTVAPSASLPGMEVQCVARTSGLQTGQILPALTSVKIYGRASPSHTYQVTSATPLGHVKMPLGIPGDSGAWIIDQTHGQLCGHVLAWSQRKRAAYICPMDVLLLDIAETLDAREVKLPGGEAVVTIGDAENELEILDVDLDDLVEVEDEDEIGGAPTKVKEALPNSRSASRYAPSRMSNGSDSDHGSSSPLRMETSSELAGFTSRMSDLSLNGGHGIGVSG